MSRANKKKLTPPPVTPPSYLQKRKEWLEKLAGEDEHSIANQLHAMTWNFARFNVVNEGLRIAPPYQGDEAEPGDVELNGLLYGLLTSGFFTVQSIAARKLVDGSPDVYSLTQLLDDIIENASLFTRANMLDAEGLTYDYAALEKQEQQYRDDQIAAGKKAYNIPNFGNLWESRWRHVAIDRLTRARVDSRAPSDVIPVALFQDLKNRVVTACDNIRIATNKYIAHAATPSSRKAAPGPPRLVDLIVANQTLCEVVGCLANQILSGSFSSQVASAGSSALQFIDRPLVRPNQVRDLDKVWRDFERKSQTWSNWQPDDIQLSIEDVEYRALQAAGAWVASANYDTIPATIEINLREESIGFDDETDKDKIPTIEEARAHAAGSLAAFLALRSRPPVAPTEAEIDFAVTVTQSFDRFNLLSPAARREVAELVARNWAAIEALAKKLIAVRIMCRDSVFGEIGHLLKF